MVCNTDQSDPENTESLKNPGKKRIFGIMLKLNSMSWKKIWQVKLGKNKNGLWVLESAWERERAQNKYVWGRNSVPKLWKNQMMKFSLENLVMVRMKSSGFIWSFLQLRKEATLDDKTEPRGKSYRWAFEIYWFWNIRNLGKLRKELIVVGCNESNFYLICSSRLPLVSLPVHGTGGNSYSFIYCPCGA